MFPKIRHINDLLPYIQHKPEISIKKQPNGTTVVCYTISNDSTFENEWLRECRGITFDEFGNILVRPLHKFFNVGEKEHTQFGTIDWDKTQFIMDKRDGSMITTAVIDKKIVCKTKKSFETEQAARALEFIMADDRYRNFVYDCYHGEMTPIFEWTSPSDRIVLKYNENALVLLHIRDNKTGRYMHEEVYGEQGAARFWGIPTVEHFDRHKIKEIIAGLDAEENKEGYIVQLTDGDMVKLKTPWYINLHHSVTFTRERDIARMVVEECIDDFKSYLSSIGESHDKVNAIEKRVTDTIHSIRLIVLSTLRNYQNYKDDRKKFVALVKGDYVSKQYFGLVMTAFSGAEPDYNNYFLKNHISEYSLEVV